MKKLLFGLQAATAIFLWGGLARADEAPPRRPPAVVVWMYGPAIRQGFQKTAYGQRGEPGALSVAMANAVNSRLHRVERFDLASASDLETAAEQDLGGYPRTPDDAVEAGRRLGVDYLIYGNVELASSEVDRTEIESGKGKKKKREVTYTGHTDFRVHHVAVDVRTGQIWKETRDRDTRSFTSDCYPEDSQFRASFLSSVDSLASRWVRQLVPERRGKVLSRGDGLLVVGLGRRDGVGMDTDFEFTRPGVLLDKSGKALLDEDGQPFTSDSAVLAAPSSKHKPGPVFGRPVKLEDDYCLVKVGYKGSGGFLGLETKLKENKACLEAIALGDDARLLPRVGD